MILDGDKVGRVMARVALAGAILAALVLPFAALFLRGPAAPETWTTGAAALAVVASAIAAWSSRLVTELQLDARRPAPYPLFDFTSRYGLVLLRIKNAGGAPAHSVSLSWDVQLSNFKREPIGFLSENSKPAIAVLLAGESIAQIIGSPHDFIKMHPDREYTGLVRYEDASKRKFSTPFRLDGRAYSGSPLHDDELQKTHYELQQIPEALKGLRAAVDKISTKLGRQ